MKKTLSVLLSAILLLGTVVSVGASAADTSESPVVERVFRTEMTTSVGYYQGTKCIILDIAVVDITDPYGLLSLEFYVDFDGEALVPLWQTDKELNGNGEATNVPPQMVTAWPTYDQIYNIPGYGLHTEKIFAVEGLCKSYDTTGSGRLNVNLITMTEKYSSGFKEDGEAAVRLYFIPLNGFNIGDEYTFVIDGNYDVSWDYRSQITIAGTSAVLTSGDSYDKTKLRVFGMGDTDSYTLKYEDCSDYGIRGDVNFDGAADNLDSAYILRYDAGLLTLEQDIIVIGDVNGDGSLDSLDAAMILKYDAGLISGF